MIIFVPHRATARLYRVDAGVGLARLRGLTVRLDSDIGRTD